MPVKQITLPFSSRLMQRRFIHLVHQVGPHGATRIHEPRDERVVPSLKRVHVEVVLLVESAVVAEKHVSTSRPSQYATAKPVRSAVVPRG
jgi:hypothetical protein